jgi:hypothetical protein
MGAIADSRLLKALEQIKIFQNEVLFINCQNNTGIITLQYERKMRSCEHEFNE